MVNAYVFLLMKKVANLASFIKNAFSKYSFSDLNICRYLKTFMNLPPNASKEEQRAVIAELFLYIFTNAHPKNKSDTLLALTANLAFLPYR